LPQIVLEPYSFDEALRYTLDQFEKKKKKMLTTKCALPSLTRVRPPLPQIDLEPYSFDEALRYTLDQCRLPAEPREEFGAALRVLLAAFGRAFTATFPAYFAPQRAGKQNTITQSINQSNP